MFLGACRSIFGSSRAICRAARSKFAAPDRFLGVLDRFAGLPDRFWGSRSICHAARSNFGAPDRFRKFSIDLSGCPIEILRLPIDFTGCPIEVWSSRSIFGSSRSICRAARSFLRVLDRFSNDPDRILGLPIVFWQFSSDFPGACAISALLRGFRTACKNKGRQICRPLLFNRYLKTPVSSAYTPSHLHANLHVLKQNQWLLLRGPAGFLHHSVHHQSYMPAPVLIHAIF